MPVVDRGSSPAPSRNGSLPPTSRASTRRASSSLDFKPELSTRGWRVASTGVVADLDHELPQLSPADLVWASMVVHHVADPVATLRRLGGLLRPGGTLVVVEFGGNPTVLPDDDPVVAGGAWARLEAGARAWLVQRLGPDLIGRDWPRDLRLAGLVDVTDDIVPFSSAAPLDDLHRRWLVRHVRRGVGMAGVALREGDIEMLEAFADAVERATARTRSWQPTAGCSQPAVRAEAASHPRGDDQGTLRPNAVTGCPISFVVQRTLLALGLIAVAIAGLVGSTGASAQRAAVVLPQGSTWGDDASGLRGQDGKRFVFLCPADGSPDQAWGTDIYTDDSSVCTAALHTGRLKVADGGMVTIEIRPGETAYTGTTRNGVTTSDYGSWSGSYVVVSVDAGGGARRSQDRRC